MHNGELAKKYQVSPLTWKNVQTTWCDVQGDTKNGHHL